MTEGNFCQIDPDSGVTKSVPLCNDGINVKKYACSCADKNVAEIGENCALNTGIV